jgi:hypothetical protein
MKMGKIDSHMVPNSKNSCASMWTSAVLLDGSNEKKNATNKQGLATSNKKSRPQGSPLNGSPIRSINLVNNYTSNMAKSSIFSIFYNFNKFFNTENRLIFHKNFDYKDLIFNLYFLPVKTLNIRINNNFYKNIFFYFMFINSFI